MTAPCEGKCGRTVTEAGKWCPSCWLEDHAKVGKTPPDPIPTTDEIELLIIEFLDTSRKYALGNPQERPVELAKLAHLVNVLQHETLKP